MSADDKAVCVVTLATNEDHTAYMLWAVLLGALCLATELAAQLPPVIRDGRSLFPFPDRLASVFSALSEKANS